MKIEFTNNGYHDIATVDDDGGALIAVYFLSRVPFFDEGKDEYQWRVKYLTSTRNLLDVEAIQLAWTAHLAKLIVE